MTDRWQRFLKDLYALLSTYEFQKDPTRYNVFNLTDWGKKDKRQGLTIRRDDLPEFLSILKNQHNVDVSDVVPNLEQINDVIKLTLKQRYRIKDDFIKLSDIESATSLEIIATDTIFIDADVSLHNLILMAPRWVIVGERTLNLDGEDASPHSTSKAPIGENGKPGLPGKNGGYFFGIAGSVTNPEKLTITANGGRGGRGQDGGDGQNGRDGINATTANFDYLNHEKIGGRRWRIYGEEGKSGGKGADGGKGGVGGRAGQVKLFDFSGGGIKVVAEEGREGEGGIGGKGGPGGRNGKNVEATYIICCWSSVEEVENEGVGPVGDNGGDGVNSGGREEPEDLPRKDFGGKISGFKATLRDYLKMNKYRKGEVASFVSQLDTSPEVTDYLGFEGIVHDYQVLEEQFPSYDKYKELFPFYRNLLGVVQKQAERLEPTNEDGKIILFHMYTSLLSKVNIIDEDLTDTATVVLIEDYLTTRQNSYKYLEEDGGRMVFYNYNSVDKRGIKELVDDTEEFNQKFLTREGFLGTFRELLSKLGKLGFQLNEISAKTYHVNKLLNVGKFKTDNIDDIYAVRRTLQSLASTKLDDSCIDDTITSLVTQIQKDFDNYEASLDITKWQIPQKLRRVKQCLKEHPDDTSTAVEVLNHVIDIYKRVESFYRKKVVSDYIRNLRSSEWKLQNTAHSETIAKMRNATISNLILSLYENDVNILKQYTFPYFNDIFGEYKLRPGIIRYFTNSTELAKQCKNSIESLKHSTFHSLTPLSQYHWSSSTYEPVATWKKEELGNLTQKLFSGEEILLKPNVLSNPNYAVHFSWVDIKFKVSNETEQQTLEHMLNYFGIWLTHSGNSYYRCANRTYVVTTPPFPLYFSYERSRSMRKPYDRADQNGVYVKLHSGNPILSPYATWSVRLDEPQHSRRYSFSSLRRFAGLVDLELVARQSWMENLPEICDRNIDDFYELEDSFGASRSRRSVEDLETYSTSAASLVSSPVNQLFSNVHHLGGFASKALNPFSFYGQVNSLLVLAPVLLYFAKSCFTGRSNFEKLKEEEVIDTSRVDIWNSFVRKFRKIMVKYELKAEWLLFNLEDRFEEISRVRSEKQAEDLEIRLVTLLADFLEGVEYDSDFLKVKNDRDFVADVDELIDIAEKIQLNET